MIWHLLTAPNEWSISFSGQYWFWSTVIMLSWAQYYSWPIAIHWQSSHIYPMAPQHIGSSVAVRQSFVSGTQWGALVQLLLIVLHRKPHICVCWRFSVEVDPCQTRLKCGWIWFASTVPHAIDYLIITPELNEQIKTIRESQHHITVGCNSL